MVDIFFTTYLVIPIILFIYTIIIYIKRKVIYAINSKNLKVKKDDFYKLQLLFCILNCILLLLETFNLYNKLNINLFVSCYLITFWAVNYLLKFIAIKNKYIEILI